MTYPPPPPRSPAPSGRRPCGTAPSERCTESGGLAYCTATKIPFMYSYSGNCAASVTIFHIRVSVSDLCIPLFPGSVHIFPWSRIGRPKAGYVNLSQIYECRNWETEHYNSVLERKVSFLVIHQWKLDIYVGFSPALHLQCAAKEKMVICVREFLYACRH